MSTYWSELTKSLTPYIPGEQPQDKKYIKLNTNENPYPPSPKVIRAINDATNTDLKLYPDPTCDQLKSTIAEYFKLQNEQIFVGNGSDEILAFSFPAFFNPGDKIAYPDITYSFYPVYANFFKLIPEIISLKMDFSISIENFKIANKGTIIPNPNAPTGKCLNIDQIESLTKTITNKIIIIDEAYIDFGGESTIALINKYKNLLVIHTLSKSRSLAGLRVGYAVGHKDLIAGLDRIKNSFNSYTLDRLALAGGIAAIEDDEYFQETRAKIIKTREHTIKELNKLDFNIIDSKANFIFASHPKYNAEKLFSKLNENSILVRYFKKPRIDNYLRISIGTENEMDELIKILKMIITK